MNTETHLSPVKTAITTPTPNFCQGCQIVYGDDENERWTLDPETGWRHNCAKPSLRCADLVLALALAVGISLVSASTVYGAHSDCADYCITLDCHDAIEAQHDYIGGCSNYGYAVAGPVYAGEYCRNTVGWRRHTVNEMECTTDGVCYGRGQLTCPSGNYPINVACVPPVGGTARFEMTRQYVSCERSNGAGFNISCSSQWTINDGGLG